MRAALILGSASCVWEDVEAALEIGQFAGILGVNDIGAHWPGVMDAWVTLHASHFPLWLERRRRLGHPAHKLTVGHTDERGHHGEHPPSDLIIPPNFRGQVHSGSSSLYAGKVALEWLGFDKIVFCGVPLTETPHFTDAVPWPDAPEYRRGWLEALPMIKDCARSMSGWTRETLGPPTPEWLTEAP